MKASPQKRSPSPRYPTKLEVRQDPELLRRHLPSTWASSPELTAAAALLFTVAFAGCDRTPSEPANVAVPATPEVKPAPAPAPAAKVAPVFNHGNGRGAMGCVVVSPPAFLTEEEAWQVIDEELAKAHVKLTTGPATLPGVSIPLRVLSPVQKDGRWTEVPEEIPDNATPLLVDRCGPEHRIAIEFVSSVQYGKKGGAVDDTTRGIYDFKEAAEYLSRMVATKSTEPILFGALYDPAARIKIDECKTVEQHENPTETYGSLNREGPPGETSIPELQPPSFQERLSLSRAESKRLLRLQVQDFIQWLQAQGAI